jgi:hypothetical protein
VIGECDASWKKFTGSKKGQFPEINVAVSAFFQKGCQNGINCIVLFLWHVQQLYHFPKMWLLTANLIHIWFFGTLIL